MKRYPDDTLLQGGEENVPAVPEREQITVSPSSIGGNGVPAWVIIAGVIAILYFVYRGK